MMDATEQKTDGASLEHCSTRLSGRIRGLDDSKLRMGPQSRGMEPQDDVVLGDARLDQNIGHPLLCTIPLDPDFAIDNINMHQTAVDPSGLFTAENHEHIPIRLTVKHEFVPDLSVSVGYVGIGRQRLSDNVAIRV